MKYLNWSTEKNEILKHERDLSKAFQPLDQEEKDLMESIEKEEWQPVKNLEQEKKAAIQAARSTEDGLERIEN